MDRRHRLLSCGKHFLAHVLHLLVLLLPTLLLAGRRDLGWAVGCFGLGMSAAAVLESRCITHTVRVSDAVVRDPVALRVASLVGMCLLALFWVAQVECLQRGDRLIVVHAVGAVCLVTGIVMRVTAIRTLGGQFVSDIHVGHGLVRDGIYAWLRHPSEIGLLLIAIGGPLLLGAPVTAVVAMTLLLPVSLWRMRRENIAVATCTPTLAKPQPSRLEKGDCRAPGQNVWSQ